MVRVTCLTISLFLLACSGAPKPPDVKPHDIDLVHKVCGEFKIVNYEQLKFEWVADHPIEKCDGYFAFSAEDMVKIKNYIKDMKRYAEQVCQ